MHPTSKRGKRFLGTWVFQIKKIKRNKLENQSGLCQGVRAPLGFVKEKQARKTRRAMVMLVGLFCFCQESSIVKLTVTDSSPFPQNRYVDGKAQSKSQSGGSSWRQGWVMTVRL